jgi:hypothetical protein
MQNRRVPFILLFSTFFVMTWTIELHALVGAGTAPRIAPPVVMDQDFKPRLGTYHYSIVFNSMSLGSADVAIQKDGDLYTMLVDARTTSKIDYLYRIRYQGQSTLDTDPLSPRLTRISQQVRSSEKNTVIRFQGDGNIQTSEFKRESGEPDDSDLRRIHTDLFMVDPFSATYLARGFEWKAGSEETLYVYTGKKSYELHLKCVDRTFLDAGGSHRAAWVIVPSGRKISDDGKPVGENKNPANIRIFLSDDDQRDVLRVEASHTMGTFLVSMDRFEPAALPAKAQ